jgi:hypothetical protein
MITHETPVAEGGWSEFTKDFGIALRFVGLIVDCNLILYDNVIISIRYKYSAARRSRRIAGRQRVSDSTVVGRRWRKPRNRRCCVDRQHK